MSSNLKIIPLGGSGEIGKNCTAVIQGEDMLIVDVGLSFPNEEMPGVDIVIPDFTYILENKKLLKGIVLTHAHEDHIGALSYLLRDVKCPVYATEFTMAMIKMKMDEKMDIRSVDFRQINFRDKIKAGSLEFEIIRVTHSIPESGAVAINTEHGYVVFTGDFKLDFTPVDGKLTDIARLTELGTEGVLVLLSDSTNVERPGWGPSEKSVADGLRAAISQAKGRVLLTTFASNVHRMQQAFDVAHELGRKVAVAGRRMEQTLDLCERLKYLKVPKNVRIKLDDARNLQDDQVVILTTGSQGEPMAALSQMSREEYSRLRIREGDTILYSARPIPGNEAAIWRTVNRLFRMGAEVIYEGKTPVHCSGHAYQEELKMMVNITRPFYLAPVHGEPRHQHIYKNMAMDMGYPEHRIFTMADGLPLEFDENKGWLGEPVTCGRVLVDNGGSAGGVDDEVLRDRLSVANDGIIIPVIAVDVERGAIIGQPSLDAKGFSGSDEVLREAAEVMCDALDQLKPNDIKSVDHVKHTAADAVRKFVHRKTKMRPLVVPAIVEV